MDVVTFLPLLPNLSPEFSPNIRLVFVVTSIDIADRFIALLSPKHSLNSLTNQKPGMTNQRLDRDNLCSNHDP